MALEIRQSQKLTQQLVMTPQLQQAIRLLQLSRLELAETVREELEQNPLLTDTESLDPDRSVLSPGEASLEADTIAAPPTEEAPTTAEVREDGRGVDIDWEQYLDNYQTLGQTAPAGGERPAEDRPGFEATLTRGAPTLDEHLFEQLGALHLSDEEQRAATAIIGNLDDDGFLKIPEYEGDPLIFIAREADVRLTVAERALQRIQRLEPWGIGARDLTECLLIQIRKKRLNHPLLVPIVRDHLKVLASRNLKALAKTLDASLEETAEAARQISELDPRPGRHFTGETPQYITPDIYIHKVGDTFMTVLNDDGLARLKISPAYRQLLRGEPGSGDTKKFLQEKMASALWLIRSIHQRQRTIQKVTDSVIKFQRDFLEHGIAHLKPLVLREVAEDIGMHESTVSRATTQKYVHTPQGIFELKYFFNTSIATTEGDEVSSESVKNELRQVVAGEDPKTPYSDQKLADLLESRGISIARRTIAKYRELLGILPSSQRRVYG